MMKQASDDPALQHLPFGNPRLDGSVTNAYNNLAQINANTIPICAAVQTSDGPIGGHPQRRQGEHNLLATLIIDTDMFKGSSWRSY